MDFDIKEADEKLIETEFWVKPTDKRWENFPPCLESKEIAELLPGIKQLKFLTDDILLTGYPRSGTTVMAEMIWLLTNNFDFERARSVITDVRFPGLE